MPFWQIWQKIKKAGILAWFDRSDSKLKLQLLYERVLDNSFDNICILL